MLTGVVVSLLYASLKKLNIITTSKRVSLAILNRAFINNTDILVRGKILKLKKYYIVYLILFYLLLFLVFLSIAL